MTATTAGAAVVDAYTRYWQASVEAAKLPEDRARVLLAPYLTPDPLAKELAGAAEWRRKHIEPWGHVTVHVMTVTVTGRAATLTECQDASTAGVADGRTHKLIPGTAGGSHMGIYTGLRQGDDGRWRLDRQEIQEAPCTRPSP